MEYKEFTIEISFIGEGYNVVLSEPKQLSEDLQLFFGEFLKGDKGDKGDSGEGVPQTLELSGRTLSISGGNSVNLPEGFSGRYQDLIGKPTLSTVATTGNYLDLFNKPTIPSSINDLSDVSVSTPADGQTLKYNNTTHKWENAELGPNDFVCTFTADTSGEQVSISCDKTVSEIKAAFLNGSNVIGKLPLYDSAVYIVFDLVEVVVQEDNVVAFVSNFGRDSISIIGTVSDNTDVWHYEETSLFNVQADWDEDDTSDPAHILNKPTLGTAAALDVAASGNASTTQVVKGDDSRLSDSRNAADVYPWAKAVTKPSYSASEVGAIPSTDKGANGGVAELDSSGKVPSSQLPSYVDDVVEAYYNTTDHKMYEESTYTTEITPTSGKIYVDLLTNKTYRWGGSSYTEISESLALGTTSTTAYRGDLGAANASAITAIKDGTTIDSFGDVETALSGKQATIDSSHKLSADLISDGSTNKVYTVTEQTKLSGIETGAQVNVKPDWNAASGAASEILNKPTIPAAQVNSDWNASSGKAQILNKPAIPSSINDLSDVNISSPVDGQVLAYNATTGKLENANEKTELPALTGSAGKVLAVNSGATGVEWVTPSGGGATPDWEQNDSTAADYIKHRTHSKELVQSDNVGVILNDTFLFQQSDSDHLYASNNILGNIEAYKYYTVTIGVNNTDYVTKMAYCCKDNAIFYLTDNLQYETERTYSKFCIGVYKSQGVVETEIGLVDSAYNLPSTDVNVTVTIKECFFDVNLYDFVNDEDYQVEVMASTIQDHILMTYSNPVRLVDGNEYKITIDGTSTVCETSKLLGIYTCVGNQSLLNSLVGQSLPDTGEDFLFADLREDDSVYAVLPDTVNYASHATASEISVFPYGKNIWQKLDSNYLNIGTLTIKQNGNIVLQTTVLGDDEEVDLPIVTGITHSAAPLGSGNSVTFQEGKKCSIITDVNSDTAINLIVNNSFDNILWIHNYGSSEVDITFSSITYMTDTVTNVYMPEDGITIPAGNICEIGIICNSSGAFITSRNDLTL